MCDLEYNFKTMSKKDMADLIKKLINAKNEAYDNAQSYKKRMLEYENFANKRMYKLDKDNDDLTIENIMLKDENSYLQRRLKEAEEAAKNATAALEDLRNSTNKFKCFLVNKRMYEQNPSLNIPDDFMLEDAEYHFPFLNEKRLMVQSTCRHRQIKIICMYGGSYYYDFNTKTLKATETGD